jgi:AcrR family transcriptional regulator
MEIVLVEGVANLTVRRVAEKAGFSYATLYHYFRNLDDLLWHVTAGFLDRLLEHLSPLPAPGTATRQDLAALFHRYAAYYLEFPQVFELFFFRRVGAPPEELVAESSQPRLGILLLRFLEEFADKGWITAAQIPALGELISSSVHGQLLMFFSGKTRLSPEGVQANIGSMLDHLIPDSVAREVPR